MDEKMESDSEYSSQDSGDDEIYSQPHSLNKLQFRFVYCFIALPASILLTFIFLLRSVALKACWKIDIAMAQILNHKGNLLKSMGINRSSNIFLSIEETLFLVQIGALLLFDDENTAIPLSEIYPKLGQEKSGCSWVGFKVYQHLKSLGYVVGRFGTPWSLRSTRPFEKTYEKDSTIQFPAAETSIDVSLRNLNLTDVNPPSQYYYPQNFQKLSPENSSFVFHLPVYEVYLPNSQFKKSCPGDPDFVVYSGSGHPPSLSDIKELERQSNGVPLKIGHVDDGRVSLFSLDKLELPVLP